MEGSEGFCRVYRTVATTTNPAGWRWFANGTVVISQGFEDDLEVAVAKAEAAYAAWRKQSARPEP